MYKTIRRIGASQLATVSECQGPLGTQLAVKEYNRQSLSSAQQAYVFAAAERWKKLTLPGLATYFDVSDSQAYIALKLFDRSVAMRLHEGPSDPRLVLHTVRGLLATVAHLHDQGFIHANLKPTNVFFEADGRLCLSDGWLLDVRSASPFPYPSNLKYLAPEQVASDRGKLSQATDLYCIGLLGLELLAGERFARGFQGLRADTADEDQAWSRWHLSSQVAPAATLFAKGCPDELTHVLARLLAKSPSQRYASARHALQDLPQDISAAAKVLGKNSDEAALPAGAAAAAQVISRPATGIVLTIASGQRAGEMLGSNENELMIGFDHDCFLRFAHDQYTGGGGKVLMRRGPQGWYVLRVSGDSIFVNQRTLEEKCPLRSGDIVRLSARGPDVQFTMQSGGIAIGSLVERFLTNPASRAVLPSPTSALVGQVPVAQVPIEPASGGPVTASRGPHGTVVGGTTAARQPAPLTPVPVTPVPVTPVPVAPLPAVSTPVVPTPRGSAPATAATSAEVTSPYVSAAGRSKGLATALDLRTWPAPLRNGALGLLGALVVILLASLLWPRRSNSTVPQGAQQTSQGTQQSPSGIQQSSPSTPEPSSAAPEPSAAPLGAGMSVERSSSTPSVSPEN